MIQVEYEGREALDHSLVSPLARTERLEEGEHHRYLSKESAQDPKVREVVDLLVYWLNQEMADERIVVCFKFIYTQIFCAVFKMSIFSYSLTLNEIFVI